MLYKLNSKHYELNFEADQELFDFIGFAERENKNRKYLFVSKVLGKHYPVSTYIMKKVYQELSLLLDSDCLKEPLMVIGLGETATGLGWGVFNEINNENKLYFHSTRLSLPYPKLLSFNENHSHAPLHHIYAPEDEKMKKQLSKIKRILIIDDEVTTGNTIENLKKQLLEIFPKTKISSLCIIKWDVKNSKNKHKEIIALQNPKFISLPSEKIIQNFFPKKIENRKPRVKIKLNEYGRFGSSNFALKNIKFKSNEHNGKKVLVLGTGEFNYAAFWYANKISKNAEVYVQSTTRSPIKVSGIIKSKIEFNDNYEKNVKSYLYNVADKKYDVIVIIAETKPGSIDKKLINILKRISEKIIKIYC